MFSTLLRTVYDAVIRDHLPRKIVMMNGVAVKKARFLDFEDRDEDYEAELVSTLRDRVQTGDTVVVVGGGWGVSSVVASRTADNVVCYEGGDEQYEHVSTTLSLNMADNVELVHAIVGENIGVYGESSARVVAPTELPACNLLALDCEGSEATILSSLPDGYRPRTVVAEVHPQYDVSEQEIRSTLEQIGYEVVDHGYEDEEMGVAILTAVR